MIKGTYFSKFLKLFLFGFGISCFTVLGNSVSAYTNTGSIPIFEEFNLGSPVSFSYSNNTNSLTVSSSLELYSQVNNTFFDNSFTSIWDNPRGSNVNQLAYSLGFINGQLYYYGYYKPQSTISTSSQGFITNVCKVSKGQYLSCTENRTSIPISEFYNLDGWFRKGIVMFSPGNSNNRQYFCVEDDYNDYCFSFTASYYDRGLTGSLNFSYSTVDELLQIPYGVSDFHGTAIPGTTVNYCPTVKEVMYSYGSQYNTGLCYSNNYMLSGNSIVSKEPEFILDVFSDYTDFTNSISMYNNYCTPPATQQACGDAFSGIENKWEIINKSKLDFPAKELRNYCYMSTLSPNATTCVASGGGLLEPYTNEDYLNMVTDGEFTVINSGTGTLFNWAQNQGSGYNGNLISTIKEFWINIGGLFKQQVGNTRASLPGYILVFLFMIVLFKLLKK